jgi:acetoin utilization deacetylase AcuC-like enzyme
MESNQHINTESQPISEEEAVEFVNRCLEGGYDDEGITFWWTRPRRKLDGRSPQEAWSTDRDKVIDLAKSVAGPMDQC